MKRLLISLLSVGVIGAVAFVGTSAFFSDTETSTDNTFEAGAIDLTVDSEAHYNNMVCVPHEDDGYWWQPEEGFQPEDGHYPAQGTPCFGSWESTDLVAETFFDYEDLKPGDNGENTISLTVDSNDAYMCAIIDNMQDDDLGLTEPEQEDGDNTDGPGNGELASEVRFFAWADDGDNIWDGEEQVLFSNEEGPASDVIDGVVYPIWTPQTTAFVGGETEYIGLYWCYGAISTEGDVLTCDGESVTNISQTDALSADISFYVEQARNNENFVCPELPLPEAEVFEQDNWSPIDLEQSREWLAKVKVNEPNPDSDFELQVGIGDSNPADFDSEDTVWSDDEEESFTLTYDGVGTATLEVEGRPTTTYPVGVDTYGRIGINLRAPADGTTYVDNLSLDVATLPVTSKSVTSGTNSLTISGVDLSSGFVLTGTFTFDWGVLTSNGENQKVQWSID